MVSFISRKASQALLWMHRRRAEGIKKVQIVSSTLVATYNSSLRASSLCLVIDI